MRIHNQNITIKQVLFGKPAGYVYLAVFIFFTYKSIALLPIWLNTRDESVVAETEYYNKVKIASLEEDQKKDNETDLGRERYKKQFFNKLEDGEEMIILYSQNEEKIKNNEQERKMFWWERKQQDFNVWWKNLQLF